MTNIKYFFILFFIITSLNASIQKNIVYVENLDSNEISIKNEFFNEHTKLYTISLGTLNLKEQDPIEFFKMHKLSNALSYKYGKNKEYAKVISGIYKTGTEAMNEIKNLDSRLLKNKPYSSKLIRHQKLFKESMESSFNTNIKNKTKTKLIESTNSLYNTQKENSKKLKQEFLNPNSKYYSIALGTVAADETSIKNFLKRLNI